MATPPGYRLAAIAQPTFDHSRLTYGQKVRLTPVAEPGQLDFDHVGAELGEEGGGLRALHQQSDFDHADAIQGARSHAGKT